MVNPGLSRKNWQHESTQDKDKKKSKINTICVGHHCTQTKTNDVNKI